MTREELDCFKQEMKNDFREEIHSIREEMNANLVWSKWILGILIPCVIGISVYIVRELSHVKETYISRTEFQNENDKLKLEIAKKFSLPVQISQSQIRQIKAKMVDKNDKEYQQAKDDEYRLTQEMIRLNYDITTRGGKN